MPHTIAAIAEALGAEAEGDLSIIVSRAVHPAEAQGAEQIALAMDARLLPLLKGGAARAAIVPQGTDWRALGLDAAVMAGRARHAMAGITALFAAPHHTPQGIHPTAVIEDGTVLGEEISIGPFVWVGPGAHVGAGARIMAQAAIGAGACIGANALLHPGARVGAGVTIGDNAILHMNAVIGADGFSFVTPQPGAVESAKATGTVGEAARNTHLVRIHSNGAVTLGDDVEVGAGTTIDRGTVRDTVVGSGTKIDNLVQIGHNVRIGENALICAQVGIAGSAVIGNRVVLGGKAGVADNATIGDDCVIGAASNVAGKTAPRSVLLGSPALPRDEALSMVMATRRLPRLMRTVEALKKQLSALDTRS